MNKSTPFEYEYLYKYRSNYKGGDVEKAQLKYY
jgi:hypothetical protein